MTFNEFMSKCTACGGNWTAMILSGIKAVAPAVYAEMPDDRSFTFDEVCFIANHLCYDRPHFRFNRSMYGDIIEHAVEGKFIYRKATEEEMAMSGEEFHREYNGRISEVF